MNLRSKEDVKRTFSPLTPALSPLRGEGEPQSGLWSQCALNPAWRLLRNRRLVAHSLRHRDRHRDRSAERSFGSPGGINSHKRRVGGEKSMIERELPDLPWQIGVLVKQ